jgi:hypothetical protein
MLPFPSEVDKKLKQREKKKQEETPPPQPSHEIVIGPRGKPISIDDWKKMQLPPEEWEEINKAWAEAEEARLIEKFQKLEEELRALTKQLIREEGDVDKLFGEIKEIEDEKEEIAEKLRELRQPKKPGKISID